MQFLRRRLTGPGAFSAIMGFLRGLAQLVFAAAILGALIIGGGVALTIAHFSRDLPDTQQLLTYQPATGTRVYAGDGTFMAEFAAEHRVITPLKDMPPLLVRAFLAAEDRDFYSHGAVNPGAIFRAAMVNVMRLGRGQRPLGASTITQQLVRHFLLTNEISVSRKIKEALLAYRIENALSKDRILEIYLNEIYLGSSAYGVASAADVYFAKRLDQLTLPQMAFLAALPKAPANYHPLRHPAAAKRRRDWVIDGMADMGWISGAEAEGAKAAPLDAHPHGEAEQGQPGYFSEEVRRELVDRFGEKLVYEGGLTVRTSYVPAYQRMAEKAFRNGLVEYDRRHGWRGPVAHLPTAAAAEAALATTADPAGMPSWRVAAVTAADGNGVQIALKGGTAGRIPLDELRWAGRGGLKSGDLIYVEPIAATAPPNKRAPLSAAYALRQVPEVSGGFTAMDPKTGRVFALVGGWDYHDSQFDRAVQAKRQPGSAIKPFVYLTALAADFTPSSIIQDAPIELPQGPGLPMWSPANYEGNYVGATTLRQALVHSRNLATARLASIIGLPAIARTVERFGIMDKMPLYYSMALGAGDTTLLRLTTAYSMIDNGGHWLLPSIIDLVQDRRGRIIYQKGTRDCPACYIIAGPRPDQLDNDPGYHATGSADPSMIYLQGVQFAEKPLLFKPTRLDDLVDPIADRQIVSMMEGVVQHGTGIKVAAVGKPLAGKTGTSSEWFDAWFVGFSPQIAAGAYVGFDTPRTLGDGETGGNVAAPIFRDFMAAALKDVPALPFPDPPGADMVLVNAVSGQPTSAGDRDAVLEAFRPGTSPGSGYANPSTAPMDDLNSPVAGINGRLPPGTVLPPPSPAQRVVLTGTGGLY